MNNLFSKHKKKILVMVLAVIMYAFAQFGLGVNVDISKILDGDLSEIGQKIEDAPEVPNENVPPAAP